MKFTKWFNFKKPDPLDTVNINDLNDSFDMIDEKLKLTIDENKNLLTMFKNLIINAGNSNAEVAASRGKYDYLPTRLNNFDSSLEQKADEVDLIIERERINNLAKLQQGSTTGDAELIDGRVGIDGNTYSNIGEGIRNQAKSLEDNINNKSEYLNEVLINSLGSEIEPCYLEISAGAIIVNNGFITGFGTQSWYKHTVLNCIKGDKFFVTVKAPASTTSLFQIAFANERGKILTSYLTGTSAVVKYTDYEVVAPNGACKMYVQTYLENSEETITVKKEKINNVSDNINKINNDLNNSLGTTKSNCNIKVELGALNVVDNKIVGFGTQSWYKHTIVDCKYGETYFVTLKVPNSIYTLFCVAFTNSNGEIIKTYLPGKNSIIKYTDFILPVPKGAKKLYIQSFLENSEETIVLKKEKLSNVKTDLKDLMGVTLETLLTDIKVGSFNIESNKIIGFVDSTTWYKRTAIECNEGDVFYISLKVSSNVNNQMYIGFTDKSNNIIASYLGGSNTVKKYTDFKVVAPNGSSILYVQSFLENAEETIVIKKEKPKNIEYNIRTEMFGSRQGEFENIPANSLISIKYAYEHGFNSIRVSVCHTSDGVPVLIHDTIINGWCKNADGTDLTSSVNVNNITFEELSKYDFGIQAHEKWKGTKVTKLEDAMKYCKAVGMSLNIEPKDGDVDKMKKIVDMIYKYAMVKKTCFQIDLYSQKNFLDGISNYSPYANLMVCGNYGTWLVNNAVTYVNNKREVWIGAYPNDYPSAFTGELIKQCYDNNIKIGIPANSIEDLKERYAYFDRLELKNIEYPHKILKDYINSIM